MYQKKFNILRISAVFIAFFAKAQHFGTHQLKILAESLQLRTYVARTSIFFKYSDILKAVKSIFVMGSWPDQV